MVRVHHRRVFDTSDRSRVLIRSLFKFEFSKSQFETFQYNLVLQYITVCNAYQAGTRKAL
jgi:hypothetical protein